MKQISFFGKLSAELVAVLIAFLSLYGISCVRLPRRSVPEPPAPWEARKADNNSCININIASAADLQKLPGVGVAIAERIVAYRVQYGPFRRPEHLMMVRGISDRKFRDIRQMIVTE